MCFCPPMIITEAQIDEMIELFSAALDDTWNWARQANHLAATA